MMDGIRLGTPNKIRGFPRVNARRQKEVPRTLGIFRDLPALSMRYKISLILSLAFGVVTLVWIQFSIPTLFGADGYLHIRMAEFLRDLGPHYNFHWARYSTFATNFADKDFLYHVVLIPFTYFHDIFFGMKVSAALFAVILYLVFWWTLARHCPVRPLIPVFLVIFLLSAPFLTGISQARNMIMVLGLSLFFTHFLIHKNYSGLFLTTVTYTLSHVSSPYLLLFAFFGEGIRYINEKEFDWRAIGAVALGLAAGFLTHPNFPNNVLVFYLNGILVPVFALKWGLELGAEFFPINTRDYALGYPFILIGAIFIMALSGLQVKKLRTQTQIWMAIAGFFFVFSFFSQRYLLHAYPVLLVAVASYVSDWWQSKERCVWLRKNKIALRLTIVAIAVLFGMAGYHTYKELNERILSEKIYNQHYETVGRWMEKTVPPGEVIFHANWSDSQFFIGLNPKDDYFVTLDPIYMYYWNPRLYNVYRDIAFGRHPDPYLALSKIFKVRYGYAGKIYFSALIEQVRADSRFEVLGEDGLGFVFRLK
jgi:hypothetical protein